MTDQTAPSDGPTEHLPAAQGPAQPAPAGEPAEHAQPAPAAEAAAGPPPPPPAAATPHAGATAPVAPGHSRWRRATHSRPLQLVAVGLVGALLGGSLVAGIAALGHDGRHGRAGYHQFDDRRGGPFSDQRGDRPGGDMRPGHGS